MVNSQGYARFKILAPAADSVKVSLGLGGRGGTRLKKMLTATGKALPKDQWMKVSTITM